MGTEICAIAVNRGASSGNIGKSLDDWILIFLAVAATAELKISIYYLVIAVNVLNNTLDWRQLIFFCQSRGVSQCACYGLPEIMVVVSELF